jgi:asparagine N-glycosylation enzyme membrane subunit Stt3
LRAMAYLMFIITPMLLLPFDATAVYLRWWSFPSESVSFLGGVPFYLPFAWGMIAAGFYLMVGRIRKIRFRGRGQLFAMIIAAPVLAGIIVLLLAVVQVIVNILATLGGGTALYLALAIFLFVLPLALLFNLPRMAQRKA